MFPNEAQEAMAKVLFFIFATLILCFGKVRASELNTQSIVIVKSL